MPEYKCLEKGNFDKIWSEIDKILSAFVKIKEEIHIIETKQAVQESAINTVKGDIQEMKTDIKELGSKMDKNFENQDNKSSKIIWFIMATALGTLINIALVLINK